MRRRRLGRASYEISVVGFGAWGIGGPGGDFSWRRQDDEVSVAAIEAAVERGIDWIDTAPVYGLGHSERVIGRALRGVDRRPLVFTKCSQLWDEDGNQWSDLSPDSIRREAEASLERLGVESLDLYQIHWPMPEAGIEAAWETLAELKEAGTVRAIGVSNFSVAQLRRLAPIAPVDTLQPEYSLLARGIEGELLEYCAEHEIGVIVYSPLKSGLLGGTITLERLARLPPDDWRLRDPMFQEPHVREYLAVVAYLAELAQAKGISTAELAVAWTLRNAVVTGAIVGFLRPDQVEPMAGAGDVELTPEELDGIAACLRRELRSPPPLPRFDPDAGA